MGYVCCTLKSCKELTILLCGQVSDTLRPIGSKENVDTLIPEMVAISSVYHQQRLPRIPPTQVGLKSLKICWAVIAVASLSKLICLQAGQVGNLQPLPGGEAPLLPQVDHILSQLAPNLCGIDINFH